MAVFQSLGTPQPQPQQPVSTEPSRTRKVLRYTMMPEILPRIRALGFHFGHFAYLLALVFGSARLIPQAHPVMNPANIGRFGVRQVIAIAANNLTWNRKNVDQIAIFSAIILGLIMIVIQAGLIALYAVMGTANAQASPSNPGSFFATPDPSQDLAYIFLAQVFGDLDNFWGSSVEIPGSKTQFHNAFLNIMRLYSMATMVIAVIIVLYYILTVIGEAAKTGTPFGQRFNSLWAPIRLVIALGLLVPLGSGLNSAQYITLWMAKMGSGLGSQTWKILAEELINDGTEYIVNDTDVSWVKALTDNIFMSEVCAALLNKHNAGSSAPPIESKVVQNGIVRGSYKYMRVWQSEDDSTDGRCGSVTISMKEQKPEETSTTAYIATYKVAPVDKMFQASTQAVDTIYGQVKDLAQNYADYAIAPASGTDTKKTIRSDLAKITAEVKKTLREKLENIYKNEVKIEAQNILSENISRGWVSSGLWYIKIGQLINSATQPKSEMIPTALIGVNRDLNTPEELGFWGWITSTSATQEVYIQMKAMSDIVFYNRSTPDTRSLAEIEGFYSSEDAAIVRNNDSLCDTLGYIESDTLGTVRCFIYTMITPDSLLLLRKQKNLDPMSALINAGADIVNKAIYGIVGGFVAIAGGSFLGSILPGLSGLISAAGHLAITVGFVGFAAGMILFYALPLFPFIYFFFAVTSWVMEIFEAIIAMPLWALAHLRIDGDGMPGQAAINGYYLLLAILLRPALIIMGLMGGYVIFGGGIYLLQNLFDPLIGIVNNDRMYGFDLLIYTIMYAYICYSLALMCFKLVDAVPSNILRWLGSGAQTFSDQRPDDPIGRSTGAVVAAAAVGQQGISGLTSGAQGLGKMVYAKTGQGRAETAAAEQLKRDQAKFYARMASSSGNPTDPRGGGGGGSGGQTSMGGPATGGFGTSWNVDPNKKDGDDPNKK